ncbi:MAG TPA: DUF3570 domain-containing protein [Opitutaceae bacterium]
MAAGETAAPVSSRWPARPAALTLAAILILAAPRLARAEDFIDYRYEDYSETGGRVSVRTQGISASEDIGTDMRFAFTFINDAIAGATPNGVPAPPGTSQVPLTNLTDHRKAWDTDLSRQFGIVNVLVGYSQSREHDYVSRGWSLSTLTDFNQKNTELLVGVAGHNDNVETFFTPQHLYFDKQAFSAIAGLQQLLDPRTSVTLNVTWGRETGFLADQYKLAVKTIAILPGTTLLEYFAENRPGERNMASVFASVNRAYPALKGALEASYRLYGDTFGIVSNTAEVRWVQKLGTRVTLAPELRFSQQDAAKFYYYNLDNTSIIPTRVPNPSGAAYSSDYRLSAFDAVTCGLRATWKLAEHLRLEAAYARYAMRGTDGTTPQSAYPTANIVSAGARVSW